MKKKKTLKKILSPQREQTCQPKIYHVRVFLASLVVEVYWKTPIRKCRGAKKAKFKVMGKKVKNSPRRDLTCQPKIDHVIFFQAIWVVEVYWKNMTCTI